MAATHLALPDDSLDLRKHGRGHVNLLLDRVLLLGAVLGAVHVPNQAVGASELELDELVAIATGVAN